MKMAVQVQGDLYRQGSSLGKSELTRGLAGVDYPELLALGRPSHQRPRPPPIHFLAVCRGSKTLPG